VKESLIPGKEDNTAPRIRFSESRYYPPLNTFQPTIRHQLCTPFNVFSISLEEIVREEFGKGNDFCQKITYRTTGASPKELIQKFRNSYDPRIAVTVDMIATGTDIKPLGNRYVHALGKVAGIA
jgi:hypothetical protein